MLLKTSISTTKKFFKRTIKSFKSLLSNYGYQKLPKSPLSNPLSSNTIQSYRDTNTFYDEHAKRWDHDKEKSAVMKRSSERSISIPSRENKTRYENSMEIIKKEMKSDDEFSSGGSRERGCLVTRKLKELERMDVSNIDHVLDIEEVLHYYSRITCPVYVDLVDKYFMEVYLEMLNLKASSNF